uniref:Uncharacterized protein n=1 Tax=viral metagenome TaxID=1070528 RepID=A0A6C0KIM5_9ZZZZ
MRSKFYKNGLKTLGKKLQNYNFDKYNNINTVYKHEYLV